MPDTTSLNSPTPRGFAAMIPEKRIEAAKKGGRSVHSSSQEETSMDSNSSSARRGFAAMDEAKRKEIASRGGSIVRRSRVKQEQTGCIL